MVSSFSAPLEKNQKKVERLALIKERYKKIILEPRKEIESEIERDMREEDSINDSNVNSYC